MQRVRPASSRITGSIDTDSQHRGTPDGLNTTLIAIATDADISDRNELRRLAVRAHDGLGSTVRPSHTRYDGDTAFVISTPGIVADIDLVAVDIKTLRVKGADANEGIRAAVDVADGERAKIEEKAEDQIDKILQPDELPPGVSLELARQMEDTWLVLQNELAALSSNSEHVIARESHHYIQRDQPDLVIAAINRMVALVRNLD